MKDAIREKIVFVIKQLVACNVSLTIKTKKDNLERGGKKKERAIMKEGTYFLKSQLAKYLFFLFPL